MRSEEEIRTHLASGPAILDEATISLLHFHNLAPRAHRVYGESESLARGYFASVRAHALFRAEGEKLAEKFREKQIPLVAVKGHLLAERFYDHPEDRPFSDLDLVWPAHARNEGEKILAGEGYVKLGGLPKFAANEHKVEFVHRNYPLLKVECHYGLGHGPYRLVDFWDSVSAHHGIGFLAPEDEYLFLLYHGFVQHRLQKLVWLLDLAQMRRKITLNPERLEQRARAMRMGAAWEVSEYWLKRFAGLPGTLTPNARRDRYFEKICVAHFEERPLATAGLRAFFSGGWWPVLGYALRRRLARPKPSAPAP